MNNALSWLAESRRRLGGVHLLLEQAYYPEAVSRSFYTLYAAAKALLTARGVQTRTHPGLKRMLSLLYVNEGLLDGKHVKSFDHVFKSRMTADYDAVPVTRREAQQCLEQARDFVEAAEKLLA